MMRRDYSAVSDQEVTELLRKRTKEAVVLLSEINRLLGEIAGR